MFENIMKFFKNLGKKESKEQNSANSKDAAKERLHLVLMQDRANVSADFLELMKQEIIDVIKKYIEIDEQEIDVRLTNKENEDGTNGAPALYANIPILNIKNDARKIVKKEDKKAEETKTEIKEEAKQNKEEENKEKEVQEKIKASEEIIEESKKEQEENKEESKTEKSEDLEEKKEEKEENKDKEEVKSEK